MSLPRDPSLLPTVRQLAERLAECSGYPSSEAARVAASVVLTIDVLWKHVAADQPGGEMQLSFDRDQTSLDVWVRYPGGSTKSASFDHSLSTEVRHLGIESVEFGSEGSIAYCHLRRTLPSEKADHQCEQPPPDVH